VFIATNGRHHYSQAIMYCKLILVTLALILTTPQRAQADILAEDSNSAVAYVYFRVGDDDKSTPGISVQDFTAQIDEIVNQDAPYNATSLDTILKAQDKNTPLPARTISMTFEGSDSSFLRNAFPLLKEKNIPFSLFISPGMIDAAEKSGDPSILTWDDVRMLAQSPLATIGVTSYSYSYPDDKQAESLTADINRARDRFRTELHTEPLYFSYPFGETTPTYIDVISKQGFAASFGQQSGVIGKSSPRNALPRFTVVDSFTDIDRFKMTSLALPLPYSDIEPKTTLTTTNPPHPGFTVSSDISNADLQKMKCFASGIEKVDVQKIGARHFEVRFSNGFEDSKGRLNCTIPAPSLDGSDEPRWRWLGFLFNIADAN